MCAAIAHEWPTYTIAQVANLPFSYWRSLRALYIRRHHSSRSSGEDDMEVVDMDEVLGIKG